MSPPSGTPTPGAAQRLLANAAALLAVRAEFASTELALARAQLVRWMLLALLSLLLGIVGLLALVALVTLALWPALGWGALLVPAAVCAGGCAWVLRRLLHEVETAPPLLHETLQELAQDRAALLQALGQPTPPGAEAPRAGGGG